MQCFDHYKQRVILDESAHLREVLSRPCIQLLCTGGAGAIPAIISSSKGGFDEEVS